jgi:molecular chaperone GrpE
MQKERRMAKEDIVEQKKKVENKKKTSSKKPNKILTEIKNLKKEKEQLQDQLLRKIAEFDNYKKRTEREFFGRALDHAKQSKEINSLLEGTGLIQKKMSGILEKQGLETLPAEGEDFDPEKHDALMQIENEDVESGMIIEAHLKGYTLNGKVIRHSQVIVAK